MAENKKKFFDYEALGELVKQIKDADSAVKAFAGNLEGKVDDDGNAFTSVQAYLEDLISKSSSGDELASAELIGVLANLTTTAKGNLVAAINEVDANVKAIEIPEVDDFTTEDEFELITKQNVIDLFSDDVILVLGETYSFAGYNWTCAEEIDGGYVLQSQGITSGVWPSSVDGKSISDYNDTIINLYNSIKNAENLNANYGSGLYLISNTIIGVTSSGAQGSNEYWSALKIAANNYSAFGASLDSAWLGSLSNRLPWFINGNGSVENREPSSGNYVVAPAFNIDASKITLNGNTINIK